MEYQFTDKFLIGKDIEKMFLWLDENNIKYIPDKDYEDLIKKNQFDFIIHYIKFFSWCNKNAFTLICDEDQLMLFKLTWG